MRISLCMIVKDAADTLERCLLSVDGVADEVVVVDTGSTDDSREIARRYGARVEEFAWVDDFAAARNFAFAQATMDYVFWLDADDVVSREDRQAMLDLKRTLAADTDAVSMRYLWLDEAGECVASWRRLRWVRRGRYQWVGFVHEDLVGQGRVWDSEIAITHRPGKRRETDRNLRMYERRMGMSAAWTPRDWLYYGHECFDHGRYAQALAVYDKYLAMGVGWQEDVLMVHGRVCDCWLALGQPTRARAAALQAMVQAEPRAELCCRLGYAWMQEQHWAAAAAWYRMATELRRPANPWAMCLEACWTWLPHIQLCVCYYHLGDLAASYRHNELARQYHPHHPLVLANKQWLEERLGLRCV
ncbi:MAG: glycosyltransferase [Alicyclobacillus sp.]|nr:glycosyltransferase [Alicyclobacillus sp.]